jgi:two-component system catabolic regulation response regulator CreB
MIEAPAIPQTEISTDWPIQVLLVEDSSEAAWLVQMCLSGDEGGQFRVEWSQNLFHAMNRLAQPGIEVILLDLGLPELDGYRSFRAIDAASRGEVPVVILTSDDRNLSKELTVGYGASDYLLKDRISPAELRGALVSAIRRGRHHQA